jgi:preprotein translocase subunit SecE
MFGKDFFGWAVLGLVVIVGVIVFFSNRSFFKESYQELKKVTWPSKEQATSSALITIAFIVCFSLALSVVDYVINLIMTGLLK